MEINLENAFFTVIKRSIDPFVSSINAASLKIEELIHQQTLNILEKPLLCTLLCSCTLIFFLSAITFSVTITTGFLCTTVVILIIEGFILGMIFSLAVAIAITIFAVVIITVGLITSCKRD